MIVPVEQRTKWKSGGKKKFHPGPAVSPLRAVSVPGGMGRGGKTAERRAKATAAGSNNDHEK